MIDALIPLAVAAQRCGVSSRTLRRKLDDPASGLRAHRIGRRRLISAAELEVWVATCREPVRFELSTDVLATFSAPARELLEWAQWARNGPRAAQVRDNATPDPLMLTQRMTKDGAR